MMKRLIALLLVLVLLLPTMVLTASAEITIFHDWTTFDTVQFGKGYTKRIGQEEVHSYPIFVDETCEVTVIFKVWTGDVDSLDFYLWHSKSGDPKPIQSSYDPSQSQNYWHTFTRKYIMEPGVRYEWIIVTDHRYMANYTLTVNQSEHYHDYTYNTWQEQASCTTGGYLVYQCKCGKTMKYPDGSFAVGHKYSYTASNNPTITSQGTLTGTCARCKNKNTVTLPKLDEANYDYTVTKEPTQTETGIGTYTWKEETYGDFTFEVVLDKLMMIGDVNSDGKVNNQDRLILTRFLAKWSDYTADMIDMVAADVNCDGKVNNQDRMILTRHLAKWTGYETLPYVK